MASPPMEAEFGCCWRCSLRLSGCRVPERYLGPAPSAGENKETCPSSGNNNNNNDTATNSATLTSLSSSASSSSSACGLCLGLLERAADALKEDLKAQLEAANFDARTYTLSIMLPVFCAFRNQILQTFLASEGGPAVSRCVDLKDVLRWLLVRNLEELQYEPAAPSGPAASAHTENGSAKPDGELPNKLSTGATPSSSSSSPSSASSPALTVTANGTFSCAAATEALKCLDSLGGGRRRASTVSRKKRRRFGGKGGGWEQQAAIEDNANGTTATTSTASTAAVNEAMAGLDVEECLQLLGETVTSAELADASKPLRCRLIGHLGRLPMTASDAPAKLELDLGRESVYFKGKYLKFSRNMPQSPWILDGERKGDGSVEEAICVPAQRLYKASECKFHAEGREDIDVRMLGSGRTFVVEAKNPKVATVSPSELAKLINEEAKGLVEVLDIHPCSSSAMSSLQAEAEEHKKIYVAVCWSEKALKESDLEQLRSLKDLEILQKTPIRVLHRRAPAVRPRTLHWAEAKLINPHYLTVRLCTQAGMYIKEFVHGDLGRTRPSLKELLGSSGATEILQLDVEGVGSDKMAEQAGQT